MISLPPSGEVARARSNVRSLEILNRLSEQGGSPSGDDLAVLGQWCGWGVMAKAFDPRAGEPWRGIGERVRYLLTPEDFQEAREATPNSFYTVPSVASAIWAAVVDLGFDGGRVLEPGCGHGTFMVATPDGYDVEWTGVERDPTTARIAALLHQQHRIVNRPLEKVALAPGSFDLALGNVPFGDVTIYDHTAPYFMSIHAYFIWRALEAVRPGGLVAVVASRFTLDAARSGREGFAELADLVGAVRLPTGVFREYGTDVVADILIFRRRGVRLHGDPVWLRHSNGINRHFVEHPDMVLGEMRAARGFQQGVTLDVFFDGDREQLATALRRALGRMVDDARRAGMVYEASAGDAHGEIGEVVLEDPEGRKEGSFHRNGDGIVEIVGGVAIPVARPAAELRSLIDLRDAALALIEAEADPDGPDAMDERGRLNAIYAAYVARYGAINRCTFVEGKPDPETGEPMISRRRPPMGGFRRDPDYVLVLSLEVYDDETGEFEKAPLLHRRVNRRAVRPERADSPAEAIALCLDEFGRLDLPTVAHLLGTDQTAVPAVLGDLVYEDPAAACWVTADEYLSGDVREKLAAARTASEADTERWERNIRALSEVQPVDLGPGEITVRLGAPWVTAGDVRDFLHELLDGHVMVEHEPKTATWAVEVGRWDRQRPAATAEWGTARMDAYRLAEHGLNGTAPVVYDEIETEDGVRNVRNAQETMLAEERLKALQDRFGEWVWENDERCLRICATYNRLFNSVVVRKFRGALMTFPGLADGITPHPWQKDWVYRAISTPTGLCGHAVGAGKTGSMFATAVKLRRLGLAQKPLIIVPNHLLEQVARDGRRWFPNARILMASTEDMSAERRRLLAARAATGDWDAIVMTHSAFTSLKVSSRAEAEYLAEQVAEYQDAAMRCPAHSTTVKKVAKQAQRIRNRMEERLRHRTDAGVGFEHLGVDVLLVDEAQAFKNLGVGGRGSGISQQASKRAADLEMKLWWLRRRNLRHRYVYLFTGTPVTNTLAEMYVLQRYLMPERLSALGMETFSAWAAAFIEFVAQIEVAPDGGSFRIHRRPARFANVPELRRMLAEVAEIVTAEQLDMAVPEAVHETVVVEPAPELKDYIATLVERADDIRNRLVDPTRDNMLKVCSDGRKAALWLPLVGVSTRHPGKVEAVVERILAIWREHCVVTAFELVTVPQGDLFTWAAEQERRLPVIHSGDAFQLVFCDLGTPHPADGQVYGQIRAALIRGGIEPGRIRFIHEARTDAAKAALFADCRAGKVDVLLGSTEKLGTGTNVQRLLVAIHHVDAPWRPADREQRNGRGIRPGNRNPRVRIITYVTEGSFDAYMWEALHRKARFIEQVLTGDLTARVVEDVGDGTLTYAEIKALATGNPLVMRLAEAEAEVVRLRQLSAAHRRSMNRLRQEAERDEVDARRFASRARVREDLARTASFHSEPGLRPSRFATAIRTPGEIGAVFADAASRAMVSDGEKVLCGIWRGLDVGVEARRPWRGDWVLSVYVDAHYARDEIDLPATWLEKGQHWRVVRALERWLQDSQAFVAKWRAEAERLHRAAEEAREQAAHPFERAGEMLAALARRQAIESEIRATVSETTGPESTEAEAA